MEGFLQLDRTRGSVVYIHRILEVMYFDGLSGTSKLQAKKML